MTLSQQATSSLKLAVVTAYPPSRASLNEYGLHLVDALQRDPRIESVHVLADEIVEGAAREPKLPTKVSVDRCWRFDAFDNALRIAQAARRSRADAVLFNSHFRSFGERSVASALSLLSAPLLSTLRIPTVLILHNIVEAVDLLSTGMTKTRLGATLASAAGTVLTRLLLVADKVSVLLPSYHDILTHKYSARNVVHVPHGVFGRTPTHPPPRLEGPRRIVTFGKFGTYKKVEILIEAVELLRARGVGDLEIVVAGPDSPNTPGYLASVQERFSAVPGLTFTGYLAEEDVDPTLASATVVVLPYTSTTGSSGVLHQVGRVGRAVVMPQIGDLAELMRAEGYAGETFESGSVESLAAALGRVLDDPEHRRQLERTNFETSRSCSIAQVASRYVDIAADLRHARKRPRARGL